MLELLLHHGVAKLISKKRKKGNLFPLFCLFTNIVFVVVAVPSGHLPQARATVRPAPGDRGRSGEYPQCTCVLYSELLERKLEAPFSPTPDGGNCVLARSQVSPIF